MKRRAFTIIELLVCLAILGVVVGLLLPAVQAARQSARRTECQNKMRQLALALHSHADVHGQFPSGTELGADARYLAWSVPVLPFLEQSNVYEEAQGSLKRSNDVFSAADHHLLKVPNSSFACPEDPRVFETAIAADSGKLVGLLSYLGSNGVDHVKKNGILFGGSRVAFRQISDGASNTILIGERPPSTGNDYGWWYAGVGNGDGTLDHTMGVKESTFSRFSASACAPNSFRQGKISDECSVSHFWSLHAGGANFGFCDGSIRFFSYGADDVLSSLATRSGGEVMSETP